jgi:hypothetical protein
MILLNQYYLDSLVIKLGVASEADPVGKCVSESRVVAASPENNLGPVYQSVVYAAHNQLAMLTA